MAAEPDAGVRERAWAAAILGGLALVAVLAFVVFKFGRVDPSPPSLREHPNPAIAGEVVYIDNNQCVIRAAASGASREKVLCEKYVQYVTWLDSGRIGVVSYGPPEMTWFEVNLATGERTVRTDAPPTPNMYNRPDDVVTWDGEVQLTGTGPEGRQTIAKFDLPESGSLWPVMWSPDDAWLMLAYQGPRGSSELWIISRDGSTQGTLATGVAGWNAVSWQIDGVGIAP